MEHPNYRLVRLVNGTYSVRSLAEHETFHPVVGPVAEAEALYVKQLKLRERVAKITEPFVIWDVGLGAAANVLTVLRATRDLPCSLRILSFDHTTEPLRFALQHAHELGYFGGYEQHVKSFLGHEHAKFSDQNQEVEWELHPGDFPALMANSQTKLVAPHAILFDAFSPAKNPAMWSAKLFTDLARHLDPQRPCAMPTYSRSTLLRVTLLIAGFFVGVGHATGEKEETTIAANSMELIDEPLDGHWLKRAQNSTSAEPLWEAIYRQAPLSAATLEKLRAHPQFR